jgi:integrase
VARRHRRLRQDQEREVPRRRPGPRSPRHARRPSGLYPRRQPQRLVFTNSEGGPIHQVAWLRNHFKLAVKQALPAYAADPADPDLQTLRFHDLRHTYVSFLVAQGIHAKAIQEQAGHASAVITLDRYGHLMDSAGEGVKTALSATFAASQQAATVTPLRAAG